MKDEGLESPTQFLDPAKRMGILGEKDFSASLRNASSSAFCTKVVPAILLT
jgi:hypothetical protein